MKITYLAFAGVFMTQPLGKPAFAQNFADCDSALRQSVVSYSDNETIRLAFLKTLSKDDLDSSKQNASSGGSVLIDGIPMSGYLNYGSANTAAHSELLRLRYDLSEDRSTALLKSYLSAESASAYAKCLEEKAKTVDGVHVWITHLTAQSVTVKILWIPRGKSVDETIDAAVTGAANQPNIQKIWNGKQDHEYRFDRKPSADFELDVNLGTYSDSVLVPVVPKLLTPPPHFSQFTKTQYDIPTDVPICTDVAVSAGAAVVVGLAGTWSVTPNLGKWQRIGPVIAETNPNQQGFEPHILLRSSSTGKVIYNHEYMHPHHLDVVEDSYVCVKMPAVPSGHILKALTQPNDPFVFSVTDSRDWGKK